VRDCIIIIPTYNEIENISNIIDAVLSKNDRFEVLIIDDGSPDGTAQKVIEKKALTDRIHLVEREGKLGLGTAYIAGFIWALERKYNYIFEMDADFSHNPDDLVKLLVACEKDGDVAVGSRYINGGKVENWPFKRVMMSYIASLYVRMVTFLPINDTTGGFVCYTRKALESISLGKIRFVGYAFQIEMKYAAWKCGMKIVEVPITFKDRIYGESKMSTKIFKEAFWGVLQIKINSQINKDYYKNSKLPIYS
jgi:dolichol-phosphate mannosyltransferase